MPTMTTFVESCVSTAAGKAAVVERRSRGKPRARKLLKVLADKKNILITAHQHPDPDALGSCIALRALLAAKLPAATISISIKGRIGGGINDAFTKHAQLDLVPWSDSKLKDYDAVILLDAQPAFAYSPLPPSVEPIAVIDHHRTRGRRLECPFCDIRIDVGATCSIVFSYFMELEVPIKPDLAATLLYAIETDLAGAAGTPGSLDNMAVSSLTLVADMNKLYQMRYVDLPRSYYMAYHAGLSNAMYYDDAVTSYIGESETIEQPAIIADFLLRFDQVKTALVTALYDGKLIFSLRTSDPKRSAGEIARRLIRKIGEGGGHRTKAGGYVRLENGSPTEIERARATLKRRLLRTLHIRMSRGLKLVGK